MQGSRIHTLHRVEKEGPVKMIDRMIGKLNTKLHGAQYHGFQGSAAADYRRQEAVLSSYAFD